MWTTHANVTDTVTIGWGEEYAHRSDANHSPVFQGILAKAGTYYTHEPFISPDAMKSRRVYYTRLRILLLICDTIHNRMTSQKSNKNPYCILVSHGCIHAPLVRPQAKPKVVCSYRQHGNVTEYGKPLNPTLDLQVALFASSKNTRCAASDVNPLKICFNLHGDRKRNAVRARH